MMPIPNRDAVALSARTPARCSLMRRIARKLRRWLPPSRRELAAAVALPGRSPLASGFAASAEETLPEARQRLFIGPWAPAAPGSVWLDKESVLFGDSTLALRQWMRENGIALEADGNEPEDHFGTVLLGGMVVRNGAGCVVCPAAGPHLLPWSGRFLSVFVDHAAHPFYQALGQLAQATLAQWQENLPIAVAQNRSIVNPSPRRYPARFYFAAFQPFTRTYRFCI